MAYTADDLFDRESFLGDPSDLDNLVEFQDRGNNSDNDGQEGETAGDGLEDDNDADNKDADKKSPVSKPVRIKRPQPKLDAERLKGLRGLKELRKVSASIKLHGKGHEAEDLAQILGSLEHWAHRLFPKLQFDDFLEKIEKLGSKKIVQNYVKRLRMGMEDDDERKEINSDAEEDVDDPNPVAQETMGEFDRLLAEQVSVHDNNSQTMPSPRMPAVSSTPKPSLTAEQRERIQRNKEAAMAKRRARISLTLPKDDQPAAPEGPAAEQVQDNVIPQAPQQEPTPEQKEEGKEGSNQEDTGDGSANFDIEEMTSSPGQLTNQPLLSPEETDTLAEIAASIFSVKSGIDFGPATSAPTKDIDPRYGRQELYLSEASSSSGEGIETAGGKIIPEVDITGKAIKGIKGQQGLTSQESSELKEAFSDDESNGPPKSSSSSTLSECSGKRSADDEEPAKRIKLDPSMRALRMHASPPSPADNTSWRLASFMSKDSNAPENDENKDVISGPTGGSDDDIEVVQVVTKK